MSQFNPTQWTLEPTARPDHLSAAVLHSLSRRALGLSWGPLKTVFLGGITFGILPLIVWPRKFSRFVTFERQQLWHLVEWLRIRTPEDEAAALLDSSRDYNAGAILKVLPSAMLLLLIVPFFPWFISSRFDLHSLLSSTYLFHGSRAHGVALNHWNRHFRTIPTDFYGLWTLCLSIAYTSHWLRVQQHVAGVHRRIRSMNLIFARRRIQPVELHSTGIGLRPFWMLAALVGLCCGAWWAIPAALAGAVHQRYIERTSTRIRAELAQRVTTMLQQQQPAIDIPIPHGLRIICRNPLCEKSAPAGAIFCPRCGSRIASRFNSGFGAVA